MISPIDLPEIASPVDEQLAVPDPGLTDVLYLTGRPALRHFLRFASKAVDPPPEGILVDEWHAARDVLQTLEKTESGAADNPGLIELGPEYDALLEEFLKDPIQRASFNAVPSEIALVELDRMVVYQKNIDLSFTSQLEKELGCTPDRETIFRMCLPYHHPQPPVKWSRVDSKTYVFVSPSNDLRFLGAAPLKNGQIQNCPIVGDIVSMLGLAIGFGSNFMNALYAENRLILHNGSHRAYTLRKMGFTHAPCIVQHVPSREAIDVAASPDVRPDIEIYLTHARPPMLRDYFNPQLFKMLSFQRRLQQITVRFDVSEAEVPAF
jgi:hypothetical protein